MPLTPANVMYGEVKVRQKAVSDLRADPDRCLPGVALEGRLGYAYNEQAFRYLLAIEQKCSERSGCPFLLLLVDLKEESGIGVRIDPMVATKLFSALGLCLRETDVVGWYREERVAGAVLIELGDTRVVCTASLEERVPPWLRGSKQGWLTAEYGMLPRATQERSPRDTASGRTGGRAQEIQRLIGRSLRAVIDLERLGERTIWVDCDVLQADGGTRTAAITGAFVAVMDALMLLKRTGAVPKLPVREFLAATSVGLIEGIPALDLTFAEDSRTRVDMNIVMTESGKFVEIQGTGEGAPFTKTEANALIALAERGIVTLIAKQREVLADILTAP